MFEKPDLNARRASIFRTRKTFPSCFLPQNNEHFIDDSFPPSERTLFYDTTDPENHQVSKWLRPHQIACESNVPWTVFRTPFPSDISQGEISCCAYGNLHIFSFSPFFLLDAFFPCFVISILEVSFLRFYLHLFWMG